MIDVLYILRNAPSSNGDDEIRYSLRSLDKFCPDVSRVFLTGGIPFFIDRDKIIFTPADDIGVPAVNHWWKVRQTIENTDISDDFILMYDDVFFVRESPLSNYPLFYRGELTKERNENNLYALTLYATRKLLEQMKKPTLDFCLHAPIRYNRQRFLEMTRYFEPLKGEKPALSVRSFYGNAFSGEKEKVYREDIKIRSALQKVADVIGTADCFSVSDDVFNCDTMLYLVKNFPKKSRWEK